jgi:hypothetical protein
MPDRGHMKLINLYCYHLSHKMTLVSKTCEDGDSCYWGNRPAPFTESLFSSTTVPILAIGRSAKILSGSAAFSGAQETMKRLLDSETAPPAHERLRTVVPTKKPVRFAGAIFNNEFSFFSEKKENRMRL